MKTKILTACLLAIAFVINSCSKEDCDCENGNLLTGGVINVNITGTSCDSVTLNESFSADKHLASEPRSSYFTWFEGQRIFSIKRYAENDQSGKSINIEFYEKNNILTHCFVFIEYYKILDNKKTLFLQLSTYAQDVEISDFTYNETTGIITGNFTAEIGCNVNGTYTNTIFANGNFNVPVVEIVD